MANQDETITVTVTVNSGTYSVTCSPDSIDVDYGDTLKLTLSLDNQTGGRVNWPSSASDAFAWTNGAPPSASYGFSNGSPYVQETDSNQSTTSYGFHAQVCVPGSTTSPCSSGYQPDQSSDPTIVNRGDPDSALAES